MQKRFLMNLPAEDLQDNWHHVQPDARLRTFPNNTPVLSRVGSPLHTPTSRS